MFLDSVKRIKNRNAQFSANIINSFSSSQNKLVMQLLRKYNLVYPFSRCVLELLRAEMFLGLRVKLTVRQLLPKLTRKVHYLPQMHHIGPTDPALMFYDIAQKEANN